MLLSEATRKLLDTISTGTAFVVGGAVRDHFLGIQSKDVDLEVFHATFDDLSASFKAAGFRVDEVGKSFGVLKVTVDGEQFDVALPRRESKSGSGHRGFDIESTSDITITEALSRRDFTMNAIAFNPFANVFIDPFNGIGDIKAGIIRATSDAFADDPLRVMRAVQFAGRFDFTLSPETISASADILHRFFELSKERIWIEWEKIATKAIKPSASLEALRATRWIIHFHELAEGNNPSRLVDNASVIHCDDKQEQTILFFSALLQHLSEFRIRSFFNSIDAPGWVVKATIAVINADRNLGTDDSDANLQKVMRSLEKKNVNIKTALSLKIAKGDDDAFDLWEHVEDLTAGSFQSASVLLTGADLINAGMKPGPEFKSILADALDLQDKGDILTRDEAVKWLKGQIG